MKASSSNRRTRISKRSFSPCTIWSLPNAAIYHASKRNSSPIVLWYVDVLPDSFLANRMFRRKVMLTIWILSSFPRSFKRTRNAYEKCSVLNSKGHVNMQPPSTSTPCWSTNRFVHRCAIVKNMPSCVDLGRCRSRTVSQWDTYLQPVRSRSS